MAVCMIWSCRTFRGTRAVYNRLDLLDQVEYRDPVTNRRKQTCPVWREEQVSSAVDGSQQVGELCEVSQGVCIGGCSLT
jgi:hypothetical protein